MIIKVEGKMKSLYYNSILGEQPPVPQSYPEQRLQPGSLSHCSGSRGGDEEGGRPDRV